MIGIKHQFRNAHFVQLTNAMAKTKEVKSEKHLEKKHGHDLFFCHFGTGLVKAIDYKWILKFP